MLNGSHFYSAECHIPLYLIFKIGLQLGIAFLLRKALPDLSQKCSTVRIFTRQSATSRYI